MVQLGTQATVAVADIAEAMHQAVWTTVGVTGAGSGRTGGVSGLVYRTVRAIAGGVGSGLDRLLAGLSAGAARAAASPGAGDPIVADGPWLAALNGVVGDRLAALGNPLAIAMRLCDEAGRPVDANGLALPANGCVVVLLHGLCMHDGCWQTAQGDHGVALQEALGACVLRLRYNSGLPIAQNGAELSRLLEQLVARAPVRRLILVGHSMGGLVARSAVQHADAHAEQAGWRRRLAALAFLGTPHHGAPLERIGHRVQHALDLSRFSATLQPLARLRSAGVTDLRHGNVRGEDAPADRFASARDRRTPLPLPGNVACFAVAGSLASRRGALADRLLGDGLVPLASALGQHRDPAHRLDFAPGACWTAWRTGHLQLLQSAEVRQHLVDCLRPFTAGRVRACR